MNNLLLSEQVTKLLQINASSKPPASELVEALLTVEKTTKRNRESYAFQQLLGTWRLRFVTGTKKTRQRAGIMLGKGRYLPSWVKISLSYTANEEEKASGIGRVQNLVKLGSLQFSLTGPIKFLTPKNILAFDFTRMAIALFGIKLYDGYIRNGKNSEVNFYRETIQKQAFFNYFLVREDLIAARGRGGGLAIWVRDKNE
jgi:hypothetical protein